MTACSSGDQPDSAPGSVDELPYQALAARIVTALALEEGERVLIGHDPGHMPRLAGAAERALAAAGGVVSRRAFGARDDFEARLAETDIYIWLPFGPDASREPLIAEFPIAGAWVDRGLNRQVHFHWGDGTRALDGMHGVHSPAYDRADCRSTVR